MFASVIWCNLQVTAPIIIHKNAQHAALALCWDVAFKTNQFGNRGTESDNQLLTLAIVVGKKQYFVFFQKAVVMEMCGMPAHECSVPGPQWHIWSAWSFSDHLSGWSHQLPPLTMHLLHNYRLLRHLHDNGWSFRSCSEGTMARSEYYKAHKIKRLKPKNKA